MAITGTFSATGQSAVYNPPTGYPYRAFNVSVWGTFVGTVQLERLFPGGAPWLPLTVGGTPIYVWTTPASESAEENETGVEYRLRCTAFTSGAINYRLGGSTE